MPDDKQTAFLQALAGATEHPPKPSTPDENLLSRIAYQNRAWSGLNIPMQYSYATDKTNGVYRVHTWIQRTDAMVPKYILMPCAATISNKLYRPVLFTVPWTKYSGKQAVKLLFDYVFAKCWESDYDPAVDGILTPANAPSKSSGSQSWNLGSDGTKLQMMTGTQTTVAEESGRTVCYRYHLTVIFDDHSEKHIWSSQINVTNNEGTPQISFIHDDNGDPDTIVAGGWLRVKPGWAPDIANSLIPSKASPEVYSLFFNNITADSVLTSGDPCMEVGPEAFVYNDKPASLVQWLRTGNGDNFFYGVMSDPGILETQ